MIDPRFYLIESPITLQTAAELSGSEIYSGNNFDQIFFASALESVDAGGIAFARNKKSIQGLNLTNGVLIINEALLELTKNLTVSILIHPQPEFAWAIIANLLVSIKHSADLKQPISSSAQIHETAKVSANVVFGDGVVIGENTFIGPNVTLGCGVHIGQSCVIGAGANISFATLGNQVKISSGVVVGASGFGIAKSRNEMIDMPHFGSVILHDNVSIGANSTIDRGMFRDTIIGRNTKIDNLVQIAHNVIIGENCIFAAHVGISGSVQIGDRVSMGGQVGIADHLKIGSDVSILASSGLMHNIPEGETWGGTPAVPYRELARSIGVMRRLVKDGRKNKT